MSGKILTLEEAAEKLRISKYTLYNWLQKGKDIRRYGFKIGDKNWVFKEEDLEQFIEERKRRSLQNVLKSG